MQLIFFPVASIFINRLDNCVHMFTQVQQNLVSIEKQQRSHGKK